MESSEFLLILKTKLAVAKANDLRERMDNFLALAEVISHFLRYRKGYKQEEWLLTYKL